MGTVLHKYIYAQLRTHIFLSKCTDELGFVGPLKPFSFDAQCFFVQLLKG